MKGYKTSKDYEKLWELIHSGYEVPCFRQWKNAKTFMYARLRPDRCWIIGDTGYMLCDFNQDKNDFIKTCNEFNIEFIEPKEVRIHNAIIYQNQIKKKH